MPWQTINILYILVCSSVLSIISLNDIIHYINKIVNHTKTLRGCGASVFIVLFF